MIMTIPDQITFCHAFLQAVTGFSGQFLRPLTKFIRPTTCSCNIFQVIQIFERNLGVNQYQHLEIRKHILKTRDRGRFYTFIFISVQKVPL